MDDRVAAVTWRATAGGIDECTLERRGAAWVLRGRVDGEIGWLGHMEAAYEVVSDAQWLTTAVHATALGADGNTRKVALERRENGAWVADGLEIPTVAGGQVVDLGVTPATNTLAIRRLGLAVGESAPLDAAWVRFPELDVQLLPQRYTRTGERSYRYESGTFDAELQVDEHGLVTRYGNIWFAEPPAERR